jgi:hypothetical protein
MIEQTREKPRSKVESMESGVTLLQEHIEQPGSDFEESIRDTAL